MRRRDVITFIGGGAASMLWPPAARLQPTAVPTIGFLNSAYPDLYQFNVVAFRQGLRDTGFTEGKNLRIEYRWAHGDYARLRALAAELAERGVSAIAATGDVASARAAQAATAKIPVVFTIGADPIRFGLVKSINRPGGNLTGISVMASAIGAKRAELLFKIAPRAKLALLMNPDNPNAAAERADVEEAARILGQQVLVLEVRNARAFDAAFDAFVREGADAMFVGTDPVLLAERERLVDFAAVRRVPAVYFAREFADAGGLISYGASIAAMYRQAGVYIGKILNGTKPEELPVVQSTRIEMVINLTAAKALRLDVPATLLALADEVIE
jgi:putative ABC transport system substrate-binding protein